MGHNCTPQVGVRVRVDTKIGPPREDQLGAPRTDREGEEGGNGGVGLGGEVFSV